MQSSEAKTQKAKNNLNILLYDLVVDSVKAACNLDAAPLHKTPRADEVPEIIWTNLSATYLYEYYAMLD